MGDVLPHVDALNVMTVCFPLHFLKSEFRSPTDNSVLRFVRCQFDNQPRAAMSKLFSESECLHIVSAASGRPFCPPPPAKNEPVQGLAALADSGQAGAIGSLS